MCWNILFLVGNESWQTLHLKEFAAGSLLACGDFLLPSLGFLFSVTAPVVCLSPSDSCDSKFSLQSSVSLLSISLVVILFSFDKFCVLSSSCTFSSLFSLPVVSSTSRSSDFASILLLSSLAASFSSSPLSKSPSPIPDRARFLSCNAFTLYRLLPLILIVDRSTESIRFNSPTLTKSAQVSSTLCCLLLKYSDSVLAS